MLISAGNRHEIACLETLLGRIVAPVPPPRVKHTATALFGFLLSLATVCRLPCQHVEAILGRAYFGLTREDPNHIRRVSHLRVQSNARGTMLPSW